MKPTPQDFCDRGKFRLSETGGIEIKLDGVIYDVEPYGNDAVQVLSKQGEVVAVMGWDGQFVVPGQPS